jgi:hypothetical protein
LENENIRKQLFNILLEVNIDQLSECLTSLDNLEKTKKYLEKFSFDECDIFLKKVVEKSDSNNNLGLYSKCENTIISLTQNHEAICNPYCLAVIKNLYPQADKLQQGELRQAILAAIESLGNKDTEKRKIVCNVLLNCNFIKQADFMPIKNILMEWSQEAVVKPQKIVM